MSDSEYFSKRARTERLLSDTAPDPRIAALHADLAGRYEELARSQPKPERPTLHIVSGINWAG